jgi:hypothetical protein
MTSRAVLHQVRVLAFAAVLFASGLAGHAVADGAMPGTSVLVALFVLTMVLVAPFATAPTSLARAVALLAGCQGLLHAALQLFGGEGVPTTSSMFGVAGHVAAMPSSTSSHMMMHQHVEAAAHASALSGMSGGHLVMLLAHLAAAVVGGAWLVAGERAFLTLLTLAARPVVDGWRIVMQLFRSGVSAMVANCPRHQLGCGRPFAACDSMWAAGVVTRRGPPAYCGA